MLAMRWHSGPNADDQSTPGLDRSGLSPHSGKMSGDFEARLGEAARMTDAALRRSLMSAPRTGETIRPPRLLEAMRYAALSPGKRLRPFVLIESARLFGQTGPGVAEAAAALECVHAYSLVHDDLPAMDNDDMRRGRPTVHRAFDEATAILAGDALLTLAFDILAEVEAEPTTRVTLITLLARAAGVGGMAGGQMLDLEAPAASGDRTAMLRMQAMKTGALFKFAAEAGATLGRASSEDRRRVAEYGALLGQVFQIADDLLDATGSPSVAGKATGKDAGRGKATSVVLDGVEGARALLTAKVGTAVAALAPFGKRATTLAEAARFAALRQR
jgi:farnesyl diphosphate synthase